MSLKPYLSFSSGELDPILTDNVTLEKFNKGLATARNVVIGKTGSITSRFSRYHCVNAKNSNEKIRLYCPPNANYVLEFGPLYVRVYNYFEGDFGFLRFPGILNPLEFIVERAHTFTESDLANLHFTTSKDHVYIFCEGEKTLKLKLELYTSDFVPEADVFKLINPLLPVGVSVTSSTGYKVDYLMAVVVNGEESLYSEVTTGFNKPIAAGEKNVVTVGWVTADLNSAEVSEVRVYSRPNKGGAYGYLGSTTSIITVGLNQSADFTDLGGVPDYTNGVQDLLTKYGLNGEQIIDLKPKTGAVYQQRLILGNVENDEEALLASRPGFQNNFYRDFPYAADSALQFKAGTSGKANVLRMVESDGIIVFTTNGVYVNSGLLSVNNLGLERKGGWIINEDIAPLVVPGGVFFVDNSNTIRQLIFSQEILAYESIEQTIFSNHLFQKRTIKTWAFQDGLFPVIIVTFSDGTWATFTYNYEHQMKAWTRSDSKYPLEQVEQTGKPDRTFFVTNKNGNRSIEVSLPRRLSTEIISTIPDVDKFPSNVLMDSIKTTSGYIMNYPFDIGEKIIITPVTPDVWDGPLELTTNGGYDLTGYLVGQVLRIFNPVDKSTLDLEITGHSGTEILLVTPSEEFPSELSEIYGVSEVPSTPRVYLTVSTITGLEHLEGEEVSVVVDGFIVSSPLNDVEEYSTLTVTGGEITLPDGLLGAIVHVGRPIVADVKTLNMSTIEQGPVLIESLNVNKLYIRVNESRGLYCANEFPEEKDDGVDGSSVVRMEALDEALVPESGILVGNRYIPPISKRLEKTIPGSWDSQGRISLRQVDPFHFEILSIIPDVEIMKRNDR